MLRIKSRFFPQQRKLMVSSAQNSSGVHMVQAPGQVQRGSGEGSGEGLEGFGSCARVQQGFGEGSGEGSFGAEPGQVQQRSGEGSTKGSGEGLGDFGAEPHQVQQGSREGSGGGFGAEPGRDQQGFGKGSEEGPGDFGADPGQVQGVPEKVPEGFGAEPGYWGNPQLPKGHCFQPTGCSSRQRCRVYQTMSYIVVKHIREVQDVEDLQTCKWKINWFQTKMIRGTRMSK